MKKKIKSGQKNQYYPKCEIQYEIDIRLIVVIPCKFYAVLITIKTVSNLINFDRHNSKSIVTPIFIRY